MTDLFLPDSSGVGPVMNKVAGHFRTNLVADGSEYTVTLPASAGEGSVSAITLHNGLSLYTFVLKLREPLTIRTSFAEAQPLRMIYTLDNEIWHAIPTDRLRYELTALSGSMSSATAGGEHVYEISALKPVTFFVVDIDRQRFGPRIHHGLDTLPVSLKNVFEDTLGKKAFFY